MKTFFKLPLGASIAFGILLIFSECSPSTKEETSTTEIPETKFTANPVAISEQPVGKLDIGDQAAPFNLPDVDGNFHNLEDYADAEVFVVNFTCNHCLTAQAYEDRIIKVVDEYKGKKVAFVAISSNSPIGI